MTDLSCLTYPPRVMSFYQDSHAHLVAELRQLELRRKYDTLYAYLQDDITRKRPSVDLVLDILCS
jgi:winged helix domain-containing protein